MSFEVACQYAEEGRLSKKDWGDISLFCYTKEEFFGKEWDEITLTHRGTLYYKGKQVGHPFRKIFNLEEHPSTTYDIVEQKFKEGVPYEVFDKCNGHLFIVDMFYDDDEELQIICHTKGSIDRNNLEMLDLDIKLFEQEYKEDVTDFFHMNQRLYGGGNHAKMTLMFESITEYDKHTMYEIQKELYGGKDCLVFLGGYYNNAFDWEEVGIQWFGETTRLPIVKSYGEMDLSTIKDWFDHTGREGYVIHFADGLRVKIKTKEYWALRFKKEMDVERLTWIWRSGGEQRMMMRLPEEISFQVIDVMKTAMKNWYILKMNQRGYIPEKVLETITEKKDIFMMSGLEQEDKLFLMEKFEGRNHLTRLCKSKSLRDDFANEILFSPKFRNLRDGMERSIKKIVDTIGLLPTENSV